MGAITNDLGEKLCGVSGSVSPSSLVTYLPPPAFSVDDGSPAAAGHFPIDIFLGLATPPLGLLGAQYHLPA